MTIEELEAIGIQKHKSKLYPNRFFIPYLGEVDILPPYDITKVFEKIYNEGYRNGVDYGKEIKISEIKRVLNIDEP